MPGFEHHRVQWREQKTAKPSKDPAPPTGPQPGTIEHQEGGGEGQVGAAHTSLEALTSKKKVSIDGTGVPGFLRPVW